MGTRPNEAPVGSTITAATSSRAVSVSATPSASAGSSKMMSSVTPRTTPGVGVPSKCDMSVASVPEAVNRTRSALGISSCTRPAQRTSSGLLAPMWVPRSSAACTSGITSGWL